MHIYIFPFNNIIEKGAMNLKESREGCMGGFGKRKGKGEM